MQAREAVGLLDDKEVKGSLREDREIVGNLNKLYALVITAEDIDRPP